MASGGGNNFDLNGRHALNDLDLAVFNWLLAVDVPDMNIFIRVQNTDGQDDAQNEVENEEGQDELQNEVQLMEEGQGEAPAPEVVDADADTPPPTPPPPPPPINDNDNGEDGDDVVSVISLGTTEYMSDLSDDTVLLDTQWLEVLCAKYNGREE